MSEALDQETDSYNERLSALLEVVFDVAEATRILGAEEPLFRGGSLDRHSMSNYIVSGQELKPGYFLVVAHDGVKGFTPDPFTRYGLKDCLAWILRYDSHHSRWSVEAWSVEKGDRSFSKLARSLKTFPRPGSTSLVVSYSLNRVHPA
ncbi:unnamed protein product [marine sediment metagenome]|uniref:Uncharacterized protein n=1 Tax=marine sediment metagenome TaxID=412755 RepID=X1VW39_9ZZZZ